MNKWKQLGIASTVVVAAAGVYDYSTRTSEPITTGMVKLCKVFLIPYAGMVIAGCAGGSPEVRPWIHANDYPTEVNEYHDGYATAALAKIHGEPIAYGTTLSSKGVALAAHRDFLDKAGIDTDLFPGAPKRGVAQGMSPLATKIVEWANKVPQLTVTFGGHPTDLALVTKYHPEVCPKLRAILIGASNITGEYGESEMEYITGCVTNLTIIDKKGYSVLIKEQRGDTWLNTYVKPKTMGPFVTSDVLMDEATKLNIGQFKTNTSYRVADTTAAAWGMGLRDPDIIQRDINRGMAKIK